MTVYGVAAYTHVRAHMVCAMDRQENGITYWQADCGASGSTAGRLTRWDGVPAAMRCEKCQR